MRFLSIWIPDMAAPSGPPSQEHMDRMDKLIAESMANGSLVTTGALLPASSSGARIRAVKGKSTIIDGPFAESKEVIAGFAILEAPSREAAIESVKKFHEVGGDGESELRQIVYEVPATKP
jgi:hypothetical protein